MDISRKIVSRVAFIFAMFALAITGANARSVPASSAAMVQYVFNSSPDTTHYIPDEYFLRYSRPIIFNVNKTIVRESDKTWLVDSLKLVMDDLGDDALLFIRSAASPEGPVPNNARLAKNRAAAAIRFFTSLGIDSAKIRVDAVTEDYDLLLAMMQQNRDPDYEVLRSMWEANRDDLNRMKETFRRYNGFKLWNRLYKEYFDELRAVRYIVVNRRDLMTSEQPEVPADTVAATFPAAEEPVYDVNVSQLPISIDLLPIEHEAERRIPLLNVHTNLLYDAFYLPQYGMTSMPNVGVEFYPKSGHFTYGAWFLTPFWRHFSTHRFLQIHNYELSARYYFRKAEGDAYYRGFYASAAVDASKYAIGFSKRKGWQGEGLGGQLVLGYVLPLDRHKAWKIHFSAGVGYYMTYYDPYLYGVPDFFGHEEDGLYYYDTNLYRPEFKRRQHRFTWMGPTQLGISLSYDLLWRKNGGGISFRRKPKNF